MVPASRPDCKLRWNIERERVQKNTGERGLDKLNFCQTTLVIFSCHGIFPLESWDRLQLFRGRGGGQLPYETLQWDHRKKFIQNNLF